MYILTLFLSMNWITHHILHILHNTVKGTRHMLLKSQQFTSQCMKIPDIYIYKLLILILYIIMLVINICSDFCFFINNK